MRTLLSLPALLVVLLAAFTFPASAQEKNGLLVSFAKKTIDRSRPASDGFGTRVDRVQTVMATVRNSSIREFAAGEVQWTIVVKKSAYYLLKYSGKEVLKPLRPSSSLDVALGAIPMTDYRGYNASKDQLEFEVIISHDGKETLRYASDKNFAALADNAYAGDAEGGGPAVSVYDSNERGERGERGGRLGRTVIRTAPSPATSSPAPVIVVKPNPAPVAAPVVATPAAPKIAETPAVAETAKTPGLPFDFFGLEK